MHDDRIFPGEDYPELNKHANAVVRITLGTPRGPSSDDAYVSLRAEDRVSGEVLVDVQLDPKQMWLLCQGGTQTWPAFISPNLDRVGKRMENKRVNLPDPVEGDTPEDERRDVWRAVMDQLPKDWHGTWQAYDTPRVNNRRQRYTIVRRWVSAKS